MVRARRSHPERSDGFPIVPGVPRKEKMNQLSIWYDFVILLKLSNKGIVWELKKHQTVQC